jgi:hypothetical protein
MRKLLRVLILGLGLVAAAGPAAAAAAQPYPIVSPNLTATPTTVTVGGSVTVTGTGYEPNETVNLTVEYRTTAMGQLGRAVPARFARVVAPVSVTADATGSFTLSGLELTQVGTAIITGTGASSGASASATVTVLPAGSVLPITGQNSTWLTILLVGSAMAAVGVIFVVLARSRRRPTGVSE